MSQPRVFRRMCSTCVFRPGNLMELRPGRLAEIVRHNQATGTALICHKTTFGQAPDEVVCRGFYDAYGEDVAVIQIVNRLGGFEEVDPPKDGD